MPAPFPPAIPLEKYFTPQAMAGLGDDELLNFGGTMIPKRQLRQRPDGSWYIPGGMHAEPPAEPGTIAEVAQRMSRQQPQGGGEPPRRDSFSFAPPTIAPDERNQIAAAFWGGKPPHELNPPVLQRQAVPTLQRLRELDLPASEPGMVRGMAMVNGVPTPTYRQPGAGALASALTGQPEAAPVEPVRLVAGQDKLRARLNLPLKGDNVSARPQIDQLRAALLGGAAGEPGAPAPQFSPDAVLEPAKPAPLVPSPLDLSRMTGRNYGLYDFPKSDTKTDELNAAKRAKLHEYVVNRRLADRADQNPALAMHALQKLRQLDVNLGRPIPVEGDMVSLKAALGDPAAAEIMNRRAELAQRGTIADKEMQNRLEVAKLGLPRYEDEIQRKTVDEFLKNKTQFMATISEQKGLPISDPRVDKEGHAAAVRLFGFDPTIRSASTTLLGAPATSNTASGAAVAPAPTALSESGAYLANIAKKPPPLLAALKITADTPASKIDNILLSRQASNAPLSVEELDQLREYLNHRKNADPNFDVTSNQLATPHFLRRLMYNGSAAATKAGLEAMKEDNRKANKTRVENGKVVHPAWHDPDNYGGGYGF